MPRPSRAPAAASASEPIRILPDEWDPSLAGYTPLANYWYRFWRPYLGLLPAALFEQLLSYCGPDQTAAWPSIRTLAAALGCDSRSLTGRVVNGEYRPGAIDRLQDAGLIQVTTDERGRRTYRVRMRPPLLTPAQVQELPPALRAAHARWVAAHGPNANIRSSACADTRRDQNTRSSAGADTVSAGADTVSAGADRTKLINKTHQQERDDPLAQQLWAAIADEVRATLPTRVARDVPTLRPIALGGQTLTLRAPNTSTAQRWRDPAATKAIAALSPVPIARVVVLAPGQTQEEEE